MNKIKFTDGVEVEITSISRNNNLITVSGNIPLNTTGFFLIREILPTKPLDYTDFTTIYRANDGNVIFSNDGSVDTEKCEVSVIWNDSDNYDGIRPEEVSVEVYRNDVIHETITLNDGNGWKKEYTDSVNIPKYTIIPEGVQAYEMSVNGTKVTYFHQADIPVPPTPPEPENLEERVAELENDMRNLNYTIGGIVG